jgi:hypothetical protein
MKKMLAVLAFLALVLCPLYLWAAGPYVITNPWTSNPPEFFYTTLDTGAKVKTSVYTSATSGGPVLAYDVGSVAVGAHNLKVEPCKNGDPIWGTAEVCQAVSNFPFEKPVAVVAPTPPANTRLSATLP